MSTLTIPLHPNRVRHLGLVNGAQSSRSIGSRRDVRWLLIMILFVQTTLGCGQAAAHIQDETTASGGSDRVQPPSMDPPSQPQLDAEAISDVETLGNAEACYLRAARFLRQERYAEASDLIFDTLHHAPDSLAQAIKTITEIGDPASCKTIIQSWQRKIAEAPDDPIGRAALGLLQAAGGDKGPALDQLNKAIRLDDKCAPAHAALAEFFVTQKKWPQAAAAAGKAIKNGLATARVFFLKGRAHDALDQVDEAEDALMESFQLDRSSPDALFLLAESAERRGERTRCERLYRRILDDVDPRFAPARERLVLLYLNSNLAEQAKECVADYERLDIPGASLDRCRALLRLAESQEPDGEKRLAQYQEDLEKILASHPDDVSTPVALAMSHLAVRNYKTADTFTDQALRIDPENIRAREFKAALDARLLRFEAAEAVVRGLLEDRPRDMSYQQKLLELALDRADNDAAITILQTLLARDDLSPTSRFVSQAKLIQLFLATDRFDEALALAKRALDEEPENEMRRDGYLAALSQSGRIPEAVTTAKTWLDLTPDDSHLRRRYIDLLQHAERHIEAEQQVLSWLADAPDDLGLNQILITLYWGTQQWDSAIEIARTGLEISEHKPVYQTLLSQTYVFASRFDEAIELSRATAMKTQAVSAFEQLILLLIRAGRLTEAEQTANKIIIPEAARRDAGHRHDAALIQEMRQLLATIETRLGRHDQAVQQLQLVHEMNPGDPGINNDLGYTLANAGTHLEEAEEMIRLAVGEQPREAAYLDSFGWVLYKRGRLDEAIVQLQRAVHHAEPDDPTIFDHLADALYRSGRKPEAEEAWQKVIELTEPDRVPPPSEEEKALRKGVEAKLQQMVQGEAVDIAPLGGEKPTTRPVPQAVSREAEPHEAQPQAMDKKQIPVPEDPLQPAPMPAEVIPSVPEKKNQEGDTMEEDKGKEDKGDEPDPG